jgi:hypothetical protein
MEVERRSLAVKTNRVGSFRSMRGYMTSIISENRKTAMVSVFVTTVLMATVMLCSLAVVNSRPMGVASAADGASLVSTDGLVVETGLAMNSATNLSALTASGNFALFDRVQMLTLPVGEGNTSYASSARVVSWRWYNSSRMVWRTADESTLLVSGDHVYVAGPVDAVVAFDAAGGALDFGANTSALPVAEAAERCGAMRCPLAQCTGLCTGELLKSVECRGTTLWAWPTGFSPDEAAAEQSARRRLIREGAKESVKEAVKACVGLCVRGTVGHAAPTPPA